ncbi:MAG: hypothetical protein QW794_04040 [Thermosphaera sp.]
MSAKSKKAVSAALSIASIVLLFSSAMDFYLFFFFNYHVPSWTIAAMSAATAVLLLCVKKLLR